MSKNSVFRTRNWVSILYPESAKENWLEILSDQHIPAFISPLHENDISHDGEVKKPHYHVVLMFQGMKKQEQAQDVFDLLGAVHCQAVKDIRGTARYLCHLDDADKAQYSPDDVVSLSGADYNAVISLNSDKYAAVREMIAFCNQNNILDYCELLDYASVEKPMWFRSLCDNSTVVVKEYLKSKEYYLRRGGGKY